jgi:hypothetical protein
MRYALTSLALLLAGCAGAPNTAAPQVLARTPGNIVLAVGAQTHIQEALTAAEEECQRMGRRHAVQRSALLVGDPMSGSVRMQFECVAS